MGRELRRKQAKREGKSLQQEETIEKNQIIKLIAITCFLVTFFCLIYVLAGMFLTKEINFGKDNDEEVTEKETVENTILAAEIFKQKEEEYYVYFYDYEEKFSRETSAVNSISETKVYKVNTKYGMNTKYVGDTANKKATSLENLKVKEHTLIKISGNKIIKIYVDEEITSNIK